MRRFLVIALALVLAAPVAHAGIDNAGTTAGNFLSVGTGASVLSMGGATLGMGDDLHASAWNPAALGRVGTTQFVLSHASLAQQSSQDLAVAGGRMGRGTTRWAASLLYQGEGGFDGRDAFGSSTGSFNVSSMALGLQVARPLGEAVTAGLGARWLSDNLGDAHGSGMALDFGLQARSGAFGFGVAARNVGGSMSYPSGKYDLPSVMGVGASWSDAAHGLRLALDANFPHAYYNDVRVGGEWRWQERVALRAGYRMELGAASGEPLGGPSFGVGAGANGVWMDYAFLAGDADAQGQHRLGLTFHPGMLNRMRTAAADAPATHDAVATVPTRQESDAAAKREALAAKQAEQTAKQEAEAAKREAAATAKREALAAKQDAETAKREAAAAKHARRDAALAPVAVALPPAPVAIAAPAVPSAHAPRATAIEAGVPAIDMSRRLPPGGEESEAQPRDAQPTRVLAASRPVRVPALVAGKPSGSIGDHWTDAPVAAVVPVPAPAPVAVNHPVRPAHAPRAVPAPKVETPQVTPPVAAPESSATPAAPAPEPAKPVKPTSPWPTVSAVMPSAQLAGSSAKVAVVPVPANAPSTEPMRQPAAPPARPEFVLANGSESLDDLAKRWDVTLPALMMENNLVNTKLKKGQKVKLPPPQHR